MVLNRKHPLRDFSWYGVKKRTKGKRSFKTALKSGMNPIFCPEPTLRVFYTPQCNAGCWFCTNKQYPDYKNQFDYGWINGRLYAQGLNRFYGHYQYYFSGGECTLREDFADLINGMYKANIVILTNLGKRSLDTLNRIDPKLNNIMLDISYHPHFMEILDFVENYKATPQFEKKVHVVEFINVATQEVIGGLNRYGITAYSTHGIYDEGARTRKTKKVLCKCSNIHIDPIGGVHTCRTRCVQNREPLFNMFDGDVPTSIFDKFIECDDYGVCAACDILREVKQIDNKSKND